MGIVEKIKEIEAEMARTQKNKATEYHLGQLKAKIAKLRTQLLEPPKGSSGAGEGFEVTKYGHGRVALIGFPSVGKSTLLTLLTGTHSEAASYEFTTLTCIPGIIHYNDTKIQLLDLPGIIEGASEGKGRGRQVIAVSKSSDIVLMVLDASKSEGHRQILTKELEAVGLRLNKRPPQIYFKKKGFETQNELILGRNSRKLLELQKEAAQPIKKKTNSTLPTIKNQTKVLKPTSGSSKNQIEIIDSSTNNQTKLLKLTSNSLPKNKTKLIKPTTDSNLPNIKTQLKKLNSTSKASNSTKPTSLSAKKSSDLTKPTTPKNKTTKPITATELKSKTPDKKPNTQKPKQPSWVDVEDENDLVSQFRDLPSRFQETLLPDFERISTTSKVYLTKANKEITNGFKPLVGKKYASTVASVVSCAFILIPLILVSFIFHRIKVYFSLQKILIFIQIYLSIYFSILSLSALVSGLEPLRFFYATSQSTYVCIQVLQTLGYVLYLLLLLMYLILVFSTETGLASKLLGLAQIFVGFAVGLHYYVTVFHRAVLHRPPQSSWKVHSIYATCFLVICLLDRAERRKKAYLEEGGAEGKKS